MKFLRMLVLAVALPACAALLAGSASATELSCGTSMCATETTLEAASEGKAVLDAPFGNVECSSTVKGHTETTGSSSETVHGPITTMTFTECGGNTVKVLKSGTLEIHTEGATANGNGTLTSNGAEVEVVHLGVQCIFTTSSTDIGTLTGSATTGGNATLDISARIPRTGGSGGAFCGESAPWTGSYKFTAPTTLNVDGGGGGGGTPSAPEEGEKYGGGPNPAGNGKGGPCFAGAPVNCATGNQSEEQTDLALGGRGPALAVIRSYNSQAAVAAKEAGPWGFGWSGPYGSHLEFSKETGAVTVVQENGAAAIFGLSGGKYVPGAWIQATLVKEGESYLFTLPTQEKLKFNSEGKLTEQKDRNGNAITLSYEAGKLKTVKDAAGRELKFTYSGSQVSEVEDPMGHKIKYAYESSNLTSVTLPGEESARWKFKYDGSHQMTEMTDGRGGVTKTEYDASHRVKQQTDPLERVTKWEYGESEGKKTTTITEPNGSTTFEKFNADAEPLEVIRAKGTGLEQKTTTEYNSSYEPTKVTDALAHATTYEYNAAGDRTLEKDAEGDERKWTYTTTHDVETETTPKGEKTTYKRDSHGNVEAIERPGPGETTQKTTFKHAENGDLESETDPLGHETKFEYDTYGDVKAKTDPEGDKTTYAYNADGQQTSEVSPRGNEEGAKAEEFETKTERDAQGRPIKVTDPLAHETKYAYDKDGNLEKVTDAKGHETKYVYDADNEKTKVEGANGTTTETAYDSMGQVKSKTNGNGKTTKYEHNALEQLTETIDSLERKTTREYDKAGNLEKLKDPEGRTTTFSYDKANRLTKKSYSEEATHAVEYSYDKDSNVTKMVDGTGTTETTYDILDRPTEVKNGNGEVVKYEYNLGNLQTKITYPNSKAVTREFDKANRLSKVTDWLSHATTFSYNRDSGLKATTFPTTAVDEDTAEYNHADQLTKQTFKKGSETLASLTYARDKVGQLESTTQTGLPGAETSTYEYDKANRLTKGAGTAFEYDNAGNPLKLGLTELKYDSASELEKAGTTTYTFDKLGERTKASPEGASATTYGYDQAGNLISVKRESPSINDSYSYDGNGLRQSETISGTTKHFAWDTVESLPLLLSDGTNYYVYGPAGLPIEQIASETATYLHRDQQGSTRLLTSQAGTTSGAYTFTPYGQTEGHTGTATTPLGYDGQYTSSDTGLIYLRARVYDPATAQFLSVDPLMAQTEEPYGYAGQNPLNRADPSGEWSWTTVFRWTGRVISWSSWGLAFIPGVGVPLAIGAKIVGGVIIGGVAIYEFNQGNLGQGLSDVGSSIMSFGGAGLLTGNGVGILWGFGKGFQLVGGSFYVNGKLVQFLQWIRVLPNNVFAQQCG